MDDAAYDLNVPSQRERLSPNVTLTCQHKYEAIADECERVIDESRSVLIGTLSISESLEVAAELARRRLAFELLNGVQDADEAEIVSRAGRERAITVATNLAGRGTDIKLDPVVASSGGLHVIVTQPHSLARVDRQLIGRCARCGDPGSARLFIAADDPIVAQHAPWLGRAMRRWHDQGRRGSLAIQQRLARVQDKLQRQSASVRWRLLQTDHDDEKLLNQGGGQVTGCFQI